MTKATHKNIYTALAAAQQDMGKLFKGAVNPHFKSKYADLSDVMAVATPALNAHGVCPWHSVVAADGEKFMRTSLSHGETDTHIECDVPLLVNKNDMQGMKSATTYAKRIGIESLTGLAPEDDDGNNAAKAPPQSVTPDQFIALRDLLEAWGGDQAKFMTAYKAGSLEQFPAEKFDHAVAAINKKIEAANQTKESDND